MELAKVKSTLGKSVFYDTGQFNFEGCSIKEFVFAACIFRADKNGKKFYQAELKELKCNSILIVPLEKVKLQSEV